MLNKFYSSVKSALNKMLQDGWYIKTTEILKLTKLKLYESFASVFPINKNPFIRAYVISFSILQLTEIHN